MEQQLISFGNYLLERYGVMVYSGDGKNQPIYQREVSDADLCNWKDSNPQWDRKPEEKLSQKYNHGDKVKIFLMPEGEQSFPGFTGRILSVHNYVDKTKYDVEIRFAGDFATRIYNIDEILISHVA